MEAEKRKREYSSLFSSNLALSLQVLVGEVSGAEAFDLLQALNTGHSGTLATIHANGATQAVARLASCVLQAGVDLPFTAIRSSIADCLNLLLHVDRRKGPEQAGGRAPYPPWCTPALQAV